MVCGQYRYAAPLFEYVRPMLIQNYLGTVGGAGLKLFPDELTNVYHWVLKEDTFWKVGRNSGFGLPDSHFSFAVDEFKAK